MADEGTQPSSEEEDPYDDGYPKIPEELAAIIKEQPEIKPVLLNYAEAFSGPLPPPRMLREYDSIVPGFAQTLLDQFVAQGDHRRQLEKAVILSDVSRANWGLAAGFTLALIGVVGSLLIISSGNPGIGLTTLIISLAPLVIAFLETSRRRKTERYQKARDMPED